MHNERYSILYSSATGNTRLLADTIRAALPQELCDAFGAVGETAAESELLYVGFWTDKGNADADTLALVDLVPVVFFGLSAGGCWNTARNTTAFGRSQSTSRTRRPSAFTSTWAL